MFARQPALRVLRIVGGERDDPVARTDADELWELRVHRRLAAAAIEARDQEISLDGGQCALDRLEVEALHLLVIVPGGDAIVATIIAGVPDLDGRLADIDPARASMRSMSGVKGAANCSAPSRARPSTSPGASRRPSLSAPIRQPGGRRHQRGSSSSDSASRHRSGGGDTPRLHSGSFMLDRDKFFAAVSRSCSAARVPAFLAVDRITRTSRQTITQRNCPPILDPSRRPGDDEAAGRGACRPSSGALPSRDWRVPTVQRKFRPVTCVGRQDRRPHTIGPSPALGHWA